MPDTPSGPTVCRVADEWWLVTEHHRVREEVFVREQRLFGRSDRDGRDDDPATIKVVALHDAVVGGAVRLYALDAAARHWQGDRLAVLASHRRHGLGAPLVRFAVATAAGRGGEVMTAHIQVPNVRFFEHLGWCVDGPEELYVGVPHVPMAIDLQVSPREAARRRRTRTRPGAVSPIRPEPGDVLHTQVHHDGGVAGVREHDQAGGVHLAEPGVGEAALLHGTPAGALIAGGHRDEEREAREAERPLLEGHAVRHWHRVDGDGHPGARRLEQHRQRAEQARHADVLGGHDGPAHRQVREEADVSGQLRPRSSKDGKNGKSERILPSRQATSPSR